MTEQRNLAFEIIAVDGSRAYFLDNTLEDSANVFEEFENSTGLSLADLEHAAIRPIAVYISEADENFDRSDNYFTVSQIACSADR